MLKPTISVIMPVYNAGIYLSESIESILDQTFSEFELIIVDDCSTDNSWETIKKYAKKDARIKILRNNHNLKLSKTLNNGINASVGDYIARMDADDISLPNRLEKQFKFMEQNKEVGISGGTMEIINAKGETIGRRTYNVTDQQIRNKIFRYSPFSHPLIIIRKDVLNKTGLYDHRFNPAEDYELYFRIGKYSRFANLRDSLLKYRIVPKSMTTGSTKQMELQTIKVRNLYSHLPPYNMTVFDRMYNWLQFISLFLIPSSIKTKIFNLMRNS